MSPEQACKPKPLWLSAVEDGFDDIRREAGERQQPADVGVRHALLGGEVGDGPGGI